MPSTPARKFIARSLRVILVVTPILALGFALGTGRLQRSMRTPPPPVTLTPPAAPDLRIVDKNGNIQRKTSKINVRMDLGEHLVLDGGRLARVKMETTKLPLQQAIRDYDSKFKAEGWQLDQGITASIRDLSHNSCLRFFHKNGRLRLLIIGPGAGNGRQPVRPVTIFEGKFRNNSSK